MLEAIEIEEFDRLPGSFFARSFVRQYAQALGLHESEFDAELKQLGAEEEPTPQEPPGRRSVPEPVPLPLSTVRAGRGHVIGALVGLVLMVVVCAGIYRWWHSARQAPPPKTPESTQESATARSTALEKASYPASSPGSAQKQAGAAESPAQAGSASSSPAQTQAGAAQTATAASGMRSSVEAGQTASVRLEMHPTSEVWVRVTGDGKQLYSGLLRAREEMKFESAGSLMVRIGRPGGLDLTWNGRDIRGSELGDPERPQTLEFKAREFRVVPPAPKPPAQPPPENDGL